MGHGAADAVNPHALYGVISIHPFVVINGVLLRLHVGGIVSDSVSRLIELPHMREIFLCAGAAVGML